MNEFLSTLFQAVLVAAVPICATFIGKGAAALARYFGDKTTSDAARKYLKEAADAITTAVTFTSQTYVDTLKRSGTFNRENQREALALSIEKAKELMTEEARAFLESAYGDLNEYLRTRVEAEVRIQKQAEPIILGEAFTGETKPDTDVTTVAAATAAATAAAVVHGATATQTTPQTSEPSSGLQEATEGAS